MVYHCAGNSSRRNPSASRMFSAPESVNCRQNTTAFRASSHRTAGVIRGTSSSSVNVCVMGRSDLALYLNAATVHSVPSTLPANPLTAHTGRSLPHCSRATETRQQPKVPMPCRGVLHHGTPALVEDAALGGRSRMDHDAGRVAPGMYLVDDL